MICIKSLMGGIAAVLMATVLAILGAGLYVYNASKSIEYGAIGWDRVSLLRRRSIWIVVALIFVAGFLWEFQRVGK